MSRRIRRYFITGALAVLPIGITAYIVVWLFRFLDGPVGGLIKRVVGRPLPGVGLALMLLLVLGAGMITTNFFGRRVSAYVEGLIRRLPVVGPVYSSVKQITDAIGFRHGASFKQVVFIEYPRKGIYTVAFVTSENMELSKESARMLNLFIPTTPNPTSGFMVVVPETEIVPTDMSIEEGVKLVISGGLVNPARTARNGQADRDKAGLLGDTGERIEAMERIDN